MNLTTKKQILDYIVEMKQAEKNGKAVEELEQEYLVIDKAIQEMRDKVKPNTIAYLQTQLGNQLGKYKPFEEETNQFIEFFKEAYPDGKRQKDYTWVLADPSRISIEQILHTLKYINAYCFKNRLSQEAKEAIWPMIEKIARTDSLKHINQVRSMEGIRKAMRIKIVGTPKGHKVVKI